MSETPKYFTAAQIAAALGRKRQAIARALASVAPDTRIIVAHQPAAAWSIAALPESIQSDLETTAQRRGFRNVLALLAAPPQTWQPSIPLAQVAQSAVDKATKLQRALARALAGHKDLTITRAALEQMAMDDYAREFGHTVCDRTIRALLKRTLDRDAGALNFSRLDIYLPENPPLKQPSKQVISLETESRFHALHEAIASFKAPASPSLAEKNYLWLRSFEMHDEQVANGKAPKKVRRALLEFLARNAPFLASADCISIANQIRVSFSRKYADWQEADGDAKAIIDRRSIASGRYRCPKLSEADRNKLVAHAVFNCGGRSSQAWRELIERRELSEEIIGYYIDNPANKHYVPRTVRDSIKHEVAMLRDMHHGPRQAKLNGAHIFRDWSKVHSLDWFQGDDFTYPVYFRTVDEKGAPILMRGQTLLMIDLRTTRILGFVLIPEKSYTANAIRTLITRVADEYGLPRLGFYFEHGTWKAKLLAGERNQEALSWPETQQGLKEFGLRFHHANLPRAKPVERVGGALQNIMEGLPGYVGRNEMIEKFERTQKMLARASKGDAAALAQIMDHAEWSQVLQTLCELYNADKQDGKMTGGLSPNDAFDRFSNLADPPTKFTGDLRYLLAHQRRAIRVTKNGITFKLNKETFNFRNQHTGPLIGQTVLTWFNPELPEILTVTDMHRQNPFTIARTQEVPAMDAPPELLAQELERIAQHNAFAKARYRILKPLKPIAFRGTIADRETVELGQTIGAQRSAELHRLGEQTRLETKARKAERNLGIVTTRSSLRRPESVSALQRLQEMDAEAESLETKETK